MPILPFFDRSSAPGAWHAVTAPGGYECWVLDAEDPSSNVQLTIAFMEGIPQHAEYLRRFARYRRSPTRTEPPLPGEYVGVMLCVYRGGKLAHRSITRHRGAFAAARDRVDVGIGPNRLSRADDGTLNVAIDAGGVKASLAFRPTLPAVPERDVCKYARRMIHRRMLIAPRCDVSGRLAPAGGSIDFCGRGSVDHHYGTGPIVLGTARCIRGRMFTDAGVVVFQIATAAARKPFDEVQLLHVSPAGVETIAVTEADLDGPYVRHIRLGDRLALGNPRVIDSHSFGLRVAFDSMFDGQAGIAHGDVFYPRQPRLPLLSSLMEWSIPRA